MYSARSDIGKDKVEACRDERLPTSSSFGLCGHEPPTCFPKLCDPEDAGSGIDNLREHGQSLACAQERRERGHGVLTLEEVRLREAIEECVKVLARPRMNLQVRADALLSEERAVV
jgi:hypothetical protein